MRFRRAVGRRPGSTGCLRSGRRQHADRRGRGAAGAAAFLHVASCWCRWPRDRGGARPDRDRGPPPMGAHGSRPDPVDGAAGCDPHGGGRARHRANRRNRPRLLRAGQRVASAERCRLARVWPRIHRPVPGRGVFHLRDQVLREHGHRPAHDIGRAPPPEWTW